MLLSMTGFGEARRQKEGLIVTAEVRTVNSRFFKLSVRNTEGYHALEPRIEQTVRRRVRRGTVQVNLRLERASTGDDYCINGEVLGRYREQISAIQRAWGSSEPLSLSSLLLLPGVVEEPALESGRADRDWPVIQETLEAAMSHLEQMRRDEGRAMAADLAANCDLALASLSGIELRAPQVASDYRERLADRLRKTLAELDVVLDLAGVVREVALFAERTDIAEELVRFRSHLEQFKAIMNAPESAGRKLEFLAQEILRETNTIGSKSNDVAITQHVIEIKTAVERIREMLQNVE